jgi:hypothetical protein
MLNLHKTLPLVVVLVVASLVVANRVRRVSQAADTRLDDWEVPELVEHLRKEGLELRVVPTHKGGPTRYNAYLTTTDKEWQELNLMVKVPEVVGQWRGTLYVERSHSGGTRVEFWGDCCLVAGPFVFFGDRDLLARVRVALDKN